MADVKLHRWVVDRSHMVVVPLEYQAKSLIDLKRQIQATARAKRRRPILGMLEFSHVKEDGRETLLAFFRHYNTNKKLRFMRLIKRDS